MLKSVVIASIALASLSLTSCDETARLAKDIQGSWCGTPERMSDDMSGTTEIVETFNFVRDTDKNGGPIIISAMISASGPLQPTDQIVQPYALTASAEASAQGTWTAIDDDELSVVIDPQSIEIKIDPSDIAFDTNLLTGQETPAIDSIRPLAASALKARLKREVMTRFLEMKHLDDVKVKKNLLRYEIGKDDFTMSRLGDIE